MKPRTKYQKQVVTSNKGLRPIKGAQMQWAFRECLDHYAFQLKHGQTTCMDCGHTWTTDEDADKCVCPKCKAKLEVQRTKDRRQCLLLISAYSLSVMDCNSCEHFR